MRSWVLGLAAAAVLMGAPLPGEGQSWPDRWADEEDERASLNAFLGSYLPVSDLGAFGGYGISMDPWVTLGISGFATTEGGGLRIRFDMTATPSAVMRTEEGCSECAGDSERLTLIHWRFLGDVTVPFPTSGRAYITLGPIMRVQLSDTDTCAGAPEEMCALQEFARSRVDPGLMAGVGWEPDGSRISAIELAGRVNHYGRGELPEASPASWIRELELSVRFPLFR